MSEINGDVPARIVTVTYEPALATVTAIQQALDEVGHPGTLQP